MRHLIPLLLASAVLPWSVADAQQSQPPQQQAGPRPAPPTIVATPIALAVAGFDADGDRLVTSEEYEAGVARSFALGDRDGDGFMGLIEFTSWSEATLGNPGTLPGPFDFDRDGDDRISRVEFQALFAARREAMDKNKDGVLTRSELVTAIFVPEPRSGRRRIRRNQER